MAEKPQSATPSPSPLPTVPSAVPRRAAFRGGDGRDPMVELTERAKLISQEAGAKVSTAMRDMISAAAGIAGFAVESARDLAQYMVRRGQMTQDEADKLIREAEASHMKRPAAERAKMSASKIAAEKAAAAKKAALAAANTAPPVHRPLVQARAVTPPLLRTGERAAVKPTAVPAKGTAEKVAVAKAVVAKAAVAKAGVAKAAPKAATAAPKNAGKPPAKAAAKSPSKRPASKSEKRPAKPAKKKGR